MSVSVCHDNTVGHRDAGPILRKDARALSLDMRGQNRGTSEVVERQLAALLSAIGGIARMLGRPAGRRDDDVWEPFVELDAP